MHDASASATPLVVALGGLDSSGGSGLVRDFTTAHAMGAKVILVPTAWTLQAGQGLHKVHLRAATDTREDLRQVLAPAGPGDTGGAVAVKIGMTGAAAALPALLEGLEGFAGPVVLDPVLATSSGRALFEGPPTALAPLIARATLVTPNAGEAEALTGVPVGHMLGARRAAAELRRLGAAAVLVKGGHLPGEAVDLLVDEAGETSFEAARVPGRDPRGTGCALATAIAVGLARGKALREAVAEAKRWLAERIAGAVARDGVHWL